MYLHLIHETLFHYGNIFPDGEIHMSSGSFSRTVSEHLQSLLLCSHHSLPADLALVH